MLKQVLKKARSEDFPGGPMAKTAALSAAVGLRARQSVQSADVLQLTPRQVGTAQ